jgi:LuxR family transcriptional regulator, maltose regulon positive regulatory protein
MAAEAVATRRRIIPRPRLTKLLDDSPARIKLLVAPAGYGKTTLAQQWLDVPERRDVWYRGGPASADVAALAAGIAIAASEIVPDAGKRMRQRIRTVGHAEDDVDVLAELFAEDVQEWPADAWLAIDDYHYAMESTASERLTELLTTETPIQMVLTTRNRPRWATARRVLYGEIQEVDRRSLAMEKGEALELLDGASAKETDALVHRARGWPAVLGIAAQAGDFQIPPDDLPDQLYEYFAEELYRNADLSIREALHRLSLVPSASIDVARLLFGESLTDIFDGCVRLGAVHRTKGDIVLHPLLRTFLNKKLAQERPSDLQAVASESGALLISLGEWDAAFQVIAEHSVHELLVPLVNAALDDLLAEGRTQTLLNWLDFASQHHLTDVSLDSAGAEVAFRQGRYAKAEMLASNAASSGDGRLAPRLLIRAGQSAVMDSRDDKGLEYFREAQREATHDLDRLEAAVGLCFAASELGLAEEAGRSLDDLSAMKIQGVDVAARKAIVHLVVSSRMAGVEGALETAAAIVPLLEEVRDPLVVTSFLNCYGHFLGLAARYVDALRVADRQVATANEYRLPFALPHGYFVRAVAHSGLRDFAQARADVVRAEELAAQNDIHVSVQAAALRARLALCRGDMHAALLQSTQRWERTASRPMMAEYVAYRAMSYACLGDTERCRISAADARRLHGTSVETITLASCAEAIAAVVAKRRTAPDLAAAAYALVQSTGGFDALVVASRACPGLLELIAEQEDSGEELSSVLSQSNDFRLGRRVGIELSGGPVGPLSQLTKREVEVADLVALGLTNRAIADRLFISESTAKAHVRHILGKLNATKRAEIAARVASS